LGATPVIELPEIVVEGDMSVILAFDVYRELPVPNGIFWVWGVAAGEGGSYVDRNYVYYGSGYERYSVDITDLIEGQDRMTIFLGAVDLGWVWGFLGLEHTAAPFFDNVEIVVEHN